MKLRLERSLEDWSKEAGYKYISGQTCSDLDILKANCSMKKLQAYGYGTAASISAASFYGHTLEHSFCLATNLRVLCWYWPSGDKIVFPINTEGSIYIGNSPEFWFNYYPFLRREDGQHVYTCSLEEVSFNPQVMALQRAVPLYIGGQTHFGHFIVDKFAHLCTLFYGNQAMTDFGAFIIPPGHTEVTQDLLKFLWSLLHKSQSLSSVDRINQFCSFELPAVNSIVSVGTAWVPADNHRPDCLQVANLALHAPALPKKHTITIAGHRSSLRPKAAYISRFPIESESHDRIANYATFKCLLDKLHVDHLFPYPLSLQARIELLSQYELIISDSGSCVLNGLLFASPDAKVYQIQGQRLLNDKTELATSQHYKILPLVGNRLFSLPCELASLSEANSWYDKVNVDLDLLRKLVR